MNFTMNARRAMDRISPRFAFLFMGVGSSAVLALAVLTLVPGVTEGTRLALGHSGVLGEINEHLNPFRTRHSLLQCGLPIYDLKIKPSEYRTILEVIEDAKRAGRMLDELKQWSKATLIHKGSAREVKIRVRGDLSNHWTGPRKSWRIKFNKDETLEGIREFNLILTSDGKGLSDHFCYRMFDRLGAMTLRDKYVVLRINGVLQGVYWQVEQVGPPLLAHHRKPDGAIFLNPLGGTELASFKEQVTENDVAAARVMQTLLDFEIDPTPERFAAAKAVTDMDDYVRYLAGSTLLCSDHATFRGDNHKSYFDPSRGLFSRIPWDLAPQRIPRIQRFELEDRLSTIDVFARYAMSEFRKAAVVDDDIRLRRNRILWSLVKDDSLLTLFDETYDALKSPLWADVQGQGDEVHQIAAFRTLFAANLTHVRRVLSLNQAELSVSIGESDWAHLRLAVNQASGVEVREIQCAGNESHFGTLYRVFRDLNENGTLDALDPEIGSGVAGVDGVAQVKIEPRTLQPKMGVDTNYTAYLYSPNGNYVAKPMHTVIYPKTNRAGYFVTRDLSASTDPSDESWPVLRVSAVNAVTGAALSEDELRVRTLDTRDYYNPMAPAATRAAFLAGNTVFQADPENRYGVIITPGAHVVRETYIVPQSVPLRVLPGAVLLMDEGASIVSYAPVLAEGREDAPIEIKPVAGGTWGTFAVTRPGGESVFKHVHVSGGVGARVQGILFSGCVAVHDGDARVEQCRFMRIPGEDALNVKNGRASVRDSYFANNGSDGIDFDFVEGDVTACHFENHLDEGVDTSGSKVTIRDSRFIRCGDKGVSCGEESRVEIINSLFLENTAGVAVKDLSVTKIRRCVFVDNSTAVMAFRKKPIFAGGVCEIINSILLRGDPIHADVFSTIRLKNSVIPPEFMTSGGGASCRPAEATLADLLRRNDYVLNLDGAVGSDTSGGAAKGASGAGLERPVAKLN